MLWVHIRMVWRVVVSGVSGAAVIVTMTHSRITGGYLVSTTCAIINGGTGIILASSTKSRQRFFYLSSLLWHNDFNSPLFCSRKLFSVNGFNFKHMKDIKIRDGEIPKSSLNVLPCKKKKN